MSANLRTLFVLGLYTLLHQFLQQKNPFTDDERIY